MKITYIHRKKTEGRHSIEELFDAIQTDIAKTQEVSKYNVQFGGASPFVIFKNIFQFKKEKNTLHHITGDVHYMALATGSNTVLTIHDIQSIIRGGFFKKIYLKLFWFWLPAFFVKKITVISEFSKQELVKIIPWARHKIFVIHNTVNQEIMKVSNSEVHSQMAANEIFKVLHLGTKSNKNLERTLEALKGLPVQLTIIGKLHKNHVALLAQFQLNYINLYDLTFEKIIEEYQKCHFVCFASTYEGFGMPIIEAQALGKPIITSNIASMPEIAGNSAILVNPLETAAIRTAVVNFIESEELREKYIKLGYENIKRFSVQHITNQYLNIYKEITAK